MTSFMSEFTGGLVEAMLSKSGLLFVKHFTSSLCLTSPNSSLSTILANFELYSAFDDKERVYASFTLIVGLIMACDFQVRGDTFLFLVLPNM